MTLNINDIDALKAKALAGAKLLTKKHLLFSRCRRARLAQLLTDCAGTINDLESAFLSVVSGRAIEEVVKENESHTNQQTID